MTNTAFVLAISTAQRICAISSNKGKTPATISPNYLLGESRAGHPHPMYYDCGKFQPIRSVLIHGMCLFEDGTRAATAASLGAPSFRRTQAPFASTKTSCSCSPWFFVLLFPHDKNFAFIFDMQALVRLFLPCGSPCVRSTSDCAVLMATPGAQRTVARLSADLYCKRPVCRSLLATN